MSKSEGRPLSERTATAGAWTVGGKLFGKALDFISLLVLARFLGPADFGVVAMAMTAVQVVEALSELPLSAVLLNVEKPTARMYDTAFSMAVLRSVAIIAVLAALSWPLSVLYHEPRLIALQCLLATAPAMRGLVSQRLVEFARVFDFRRDVALEIFGKAGSLVIATTLAITTHSYWAIAAGTVSTTLVMMIVSYAFAPQRIRFDLSQWRLFADMVGWNAAGQVVSAINWQVDKIVLPRFVDTMTFGRFTSADNLIGMPLQAIIVPLSKPLYTAFVATRARGDTARVYLKAYAGIFSLVGLILLMIAILAHPIVQLILGPKWLETAPILSWLALTAIAMLPSVVLPPLAMALNQTRMVFFNLTVQFMVKVPLIIVLAITMQLQGVLIGHAVASAVAFVTCLLIVRQMANLPVKTQLLALVRPVMAALPTTVFMLLAMNTFSALETPLYLFLNLSWVCTGAAIIFAGSSLALWKMAGCPDGYESLAVRLTGKMIRRT